MLPSTGFLPRPGNDGREGAEPMTSTVGTPDAARMIDDVEWLYAVPDWDGVRAFLLANPDVVPLVVEAAAEVRARWPEERSLALDILHDAEDETAAGELYAVVPTVLPPEEALPRMARFRQEWLNDAARRGKGRFNVVLAYV